MKTLRTIRIVCFVFLVMVGAKLNASDFIVDGICYDVVSFADMTCSVAPSDDKYAGDIIIPERVVYNNRTFTVVCIGDSAFYKCVNLTSVTIPNSVTSIGDSAFEYCSGLTSITIPNSVTSIGFGAFAYCRGLTSVTIPDSVMSIGYSAFYGCSGLTSVTISNSVTSIAAGTFYECVGLTNITIPNSVTSIGYAAFYGCSGLTSVTIPNSVTNMGYAAFYGCSGLTSVTIPNSLTIIETDVFYGCFGLTSVTIPNSVTSIGARAFYACHGLRSVTIPNSITSIGNSVFWGCGSLRKLTIEDGNSPLKLEYASVYYDNTRYMADCFSHSPLDTLYLGRPCYRDGSGDSPFKKETLREVAIGGSVTTIGADDFSGCSGLENMVIGSSVTCIEMNAFAGCSSLTNLYVLNPIPPTLGSGFTNPQYMNLNVYVPNGTLASYQNADVWKLFWNLQEKDFTGTGIDAVELKKATSDAKYWDINGRRLSAPKRGLNIFNGKKVMIK
ncbi:MAG: leucine-rich repeat domain-containing protein [Prevotella sp.]|nr:leucine-rich repeat domain-containing protein [Prevotella sp.]